MSAGHLNDNKYNDMVNNAQTGNFISSQKFKDFIGDVREKINDNWDAFDAHKNDTSVHMTQAEKDKLAGIEPGAQVNQNAFSQVNDIQATNPTDTLNIVGGTGVAITTNPATKTLNITVTGEATPGPHATSHITGGTDVIPDAVANASSGLMSASDKAKLDAINFQNNLVPYAAATGSANAYSVTLNPAPLVYVDGMAIAVKINVDNTGPSTLNVNGLGAKAIKKPNGNDVAAGNLKAGSIYTFRYNGVNFILQAEGGGGNAQPADVLSGKTFTNDQGEQTGTMPNRTGHVTGQSISRSGTTLRIRPQQGYYPGDAANSVQWDDPNWVAANIPDDIPGIFGLIGTMKRGRIATGDIASTKSFTIAGLAFAPDYVIWWSTVDSPSNYFTFGFAVRNGFTIDGTLRTAVIGSNSSNGRWVQHQDATFTSDGMSFHNSNTFVENLPGSYIAIKIG